MMSNKSNLLLFPWLGHGHISHFLQLAKELNNSEHFNVYICSTPVNLVSVKKTLRNEGLSLSIHVIELLLPVLPGLPSHLHSTNGLPLHLIPILKQAFDMSSPKFMEILKNLCPDLLIYDILQPWAPAAAASLGIPYVVFITTSITASVYQFHLKGVFPFAKPLYFLDHKNVKVSSSAKVKEEDRVTQCVASSSSIVLIKSFNELHQLCKSASLQGGLKLHKRTKSDEFTYDHSSYLYADQVDLKIEANKLTEKIYQELKKPPPPAPHSMAELHWFSWEGENVFNFNLNGPM